MVADSFGGGGAHRPVGELDRTHDAAGPGDHGHRTVRAQRWPHTANPHLFIHHRTALGTKPVGTRWPGLVLGTAVRDIRTDRILDEVRATDGDLRRICALFGMSVARAARYTAILDHPDLVARHDVGP